MIFLMLSEVSMYFNDHKGKPFCLENSPMIAHLASFKLVTSLCPGNLSKLNTFIRFLHNSPLSLLSNWKFSLLLSFCSSQTLNISTTSSTRCCASLGLPLESKSCLIYALMANATIAIPAYDWNKP